MYVLYARKLAPLVMRSLSREVSPNDGLNVRLPDGESMERPLERSQFDDGDGDGDGDVGNDDGDGEIILVI